MRFLVALALAAVLVHPAEGASASYLGSWGECVPGSGPSFTPVDVSVGPDGSVYVLDEPAAHVLRFSDTGQLLGSWGSEGSAVGQFHNPQSLAVAPSGDVYVSDTFNHRVQRFDAGGGFVQQWGSQGTAAGQFQSPRGIVALPDGHVVVVDASSRAQEFSGDGTFLRSWPFDPNSYQVTAGYGVARSALGEYFIVTQGPGQVHRYAADGTLLTSWGTSGTGAGEFVGPIDVGCTAGGNVLVTDYALETSRIQEYTPDGVFVQAWGGPGTGPGQFQRAMGLAITASGDFYVADLGNCRVQKYGAGVVPVRRSSWGRIKSVYR